MRTEKVPGTGKRCGLINYRLWAVDGEGTRIVLPVLVPEYAIVRARNSLCERLSEEYDEVTGGRI